MSENLVQGIMLENGQIGIVDYDYLANKPVLDNYALKEDIKSFIITVEDTGKIDDSGYSLYKIDRTYQEIETAYNNGQRLQLFTPSNRLIDLTRFNSKDGSFDFETLGDSANIFEWWWLEKDGILRRADYSIVTANGKSIEAFSRFDNDTKMFREALGNILVEITLKDGSKKTVIKGDGQQHCVYVPGGVYKINDTIVIPENCSLTLSQDTILRFTQTSGNCIEMRGSATLNGNHGNIDVSQDFTGNVISVDTGLDGVVHASIPPYTKSTPMWKRQRFIENINITKTESHGFQAVYSKTSEISGTALYISANYETEEAYAGTGNAPISFIWGMAVSGLRIAGAFKYGINIQNRDKTDSGYGDAGDPAWNHDMRIEAVIVSCETGVRVFNCNTAHLAVTIQPSTSIEDGIVYAKNGIVLEHSQNIDLGSSIVWDWNADHSLVDQNEKYSHIALYGDCHGLILSDFLYYEKPSTISDLRDLIYTDDISNYNKMTILQEPITKWFKPVKESIGEGDFITVPYFDNGANIQRLALQSDLDSKFDVVEVPKYTNILLKATDGLGNIYGQYGYKENIQLGTTGQETSRSNFMTTGILSVWDNVPVGEDSVFYIKNINFEKAFRQNGNTIGDGESLLYIYRTNGQASLKGSNWLGDNYHQIMEAINKDEHYWKLTFKNKDNGGYVIRGLVTDFQMSVQGGLLDNATPIIAREEIKTESMGSLSQGITIVPSQIVGMEEYFQPLYEKTVTISSSSTNEQYPTARAVFEYVNTVLSEVENGSY